MRIIHLTHYFLPESFGGTQSYVANLAHGQIARGHEALVVTGSPRLDSAVPFEHGDYQGIPTFRIFRQDESEFFSGDTGSPRILADVLNFVAEAKPDLVHLHHWHALSRGLVPELKQRGLTVVVTLHDLFSTCMRFFRMPDPRRMCAVDVDFDECARCVSPDLPTRPLEELEFFARNRFESFQAELAQADQVICVSAAQKDLLKSVPGFNAPLHVLPIGVPGLIPEPYELRQDDIIKVVCWGGIEPRKGIHLLSAALAGSDHNQVFELHLHGQPSSSEYEDEIRAAGKDVNITFHGRYEDEELSQFSKRYDLAVFPFIAFETYALSVDEALHLGIPLIVCDRGAPQERILGRGMSFQAENIGALTSLLDQIVRQPRLLEDMRSAAHGAILIDPHIDQLMQVYGEFVS